MKRDSRSTRFGLFLLLRTGLATLVALLVATPALTAGQSSPLGDTDPGELVRKAVAHEVAEYQNPSTKHMFRSLKQGPRGSQTKLYAQTRDAIAGMVIAYDDRPVTDAELGGEEAHLQGLIDHPELLRRKQQQEKEDADRFLRLVKALPDAFFYDYDGTEMGNADFGQPGEALVRLKSRPNPNYNPPTRVEQVIVGMQGTIVIDAQRLRIARIEGTLFRDVQLGWGILGRLDKGGHMRIERADTGDGTWDFRRMTLNFTGKILLFKNFSVASSEVFSDFRRVPANTTFAQGVELLKAEQSKLALNGQTLAH
jgi:hypothetical protein